MPNPLLLDITLFLVDASLVNGDGVDTFRDFMPEEPNDAVCLYEYAGDSANAFDEAVHRSVQILIRSSLADSAREQAKNIYKAIKAAQGPDNKVTFTPERWGQVYIRQPPFFLKRDENNRTYYVFNLGITTTIE